MVSLPKAIFLIFSGDRVYVVVVGFLGAPDGDKRVGGEFFTRPIFVSPSAP